MNDPQPLPTDAELRTWVQSLIADDDSVRTNDERDHMNFARAVLAKWGSQPAVEGEPIGYLYCGGSYGDELEDWEFVADQHQCDKLNEHHGALGKEAKLPIYTTPQPTQPQAGAVPLTDEQIGQDPIFRAGVRFAEQAHGIKGGQHAD